MKRRSVGAKLKICLEIMIIIVLLPYIITIFMNGRDMTENLVEERMVQVEEKDGMKEIPLREYCIGVFAKSIDVKDKKEALLAQSIIIRTQIYKNMSDHPDEPLKETYFTKQDMEHKWGISNYRKNYEKLENIWDLTSGMVLTYEGEIITAAYHKISNGSTRDGKEVLKEENYPYLKIKECPKDVEAPEQMQTIVLDDMDAKVTKYDSAGYALSVQVGEKNYSGEEFRDAHGLASSCFMIQKYDGKLRVTTRGVGHGLGMSQYAANEMAKEGKDYVEILKYFFDGTEIREVVEIL